MSLGAVGGLGGTGVTPGLHQWRSGSGRVGSGQVGVGSGQGTQSQTYRFARCGGRSRRYSCDLRAPLVEAGVAGVAGSAGALSSDPRFCPSLRPPVLKTHKHHSTNSVHKQRKQTSYRDTDTQTAYTNFIQRHKQTHKQRTQTLYRDTDTQTAYTNIQRQTT